MHPHTYATHSADSPSRKRRAEAAGLVCPHCSQEEDLPISIADTTESISRGKVLKQAKNQNTMKTVSQRKINELVFNFIVEDVQAFSLVEQPSFIKLIEGLQPGRTIVCRKTLSEQITQSFQSMKETLTSKLKHVDIVCTTADIWTAYNCSYFAMTCHWIEESTLERQSVALACIRLQGKHTCDLITEKLNEVHVNFGIQNKVRCIVTGSGSNFVKVFKEFAYKEEDSHAEQDDVTAFEDVAEILDSANRKCYSLLPPHQRCAAHTLYLITSKDVDQAMSHESTHDLYRSVMTKCSAIWNKAHRSPLVTEIIEDIAKMKMVVPNATTLNCEYHIIQKILLLSKERLLAACKCLGVEQFQQHEITFLQEYAEVLQPLACAINLFEGGKKCFPGYVLPTLITLKTKLSDKKPCVRFTLPLVDTIITSVDRCFEQYMSNRDATMAALTIPKFRMWWLPSEKTEEMKKMLLEDAVFQERAFKYSVHTDDTKLSSESDESEDNFFAFATTQGHSDVSSIAEDEVRRYLQDTDKSFACLKKYPIVRCLFIKYNTTLPSRVPVERLFSHEDHIITTRCNRRNDEHFEQVLLLRYNLSVCPFTVCDD